MKRAAERRAQTSALHPRGTVSQRRVEKTPPPLPGGTLTCTRTNDSLLSATRAAVLAGGGITGRAVPAGVEPERVTIPRELPHAAASKSTSRLPMQTKILRAMP
jgi:hypothetical protein